MSRPRSADLAIIGGGLVGCATAFFATQAGLDVVVLEARPQLATLTTPASTGAFRLQFDNAEEIALVREGIDLFEHFAERTGLAGYDLGLLPKRLPLLRPGRGEPGPPEADGRPPAGGRRDRHRTAVRRRGAQPVPISRPDVLRARGSGRATGSSTRSDSRSATRSRHRAARAWSDRPGPARRRSASASASTAIQVARRPGSRRRDGHGAVQRRGW